MNTYAKYTANVFVAKCDEQHEKGETITLTTKYGKEHDCIVFNFLFSKEDSFYYSIVRADGFNYQEFCKQKAERYQAWAVTAENKSTEYWKASHEGRDFLSLGEPIKIGHHSERRHRALIERNHNRMGKSIEMSEKAEAHESKADYWEQRANKINLSMPESIEFYEFKLEQAKEKHKTLKDNPDQRSHSYSLTYANKEVKETEKNLEIAVKLWGSDEVVKLINSEKEEKAKKKADKYGKTDELFLKYGGFWFFGSDKEEFTKSYNKLLDDGFLEEGEKVKHIINGLYVPAKNADLFIQELKKK